MTSPIALTFQRRGCRMKTIFVPVSGTSTDGAVFATALALGRLLPSAHLEFYHLRLDPCESALRHPPANFSIGAAVGATLSHFEARDRSLAMEAAHHFQDFCERHDVSAVANDLHVRSADEALC